MARNEIAGVLAEVDGIEHAFLIRWPAGSSLTLGQRFEASDFMERMAAEYGLDHETVDDWATEFTTRADRVVQEVLHGCQRRLRLDVG